MPLLGGLPLGLWASLGRAAGILLTGSPAIPGSLRLPGVWVFGYYCRFVSVHLACFFPCFVLLW